MKIKNNSVTINLPSPELKLSEFYSEKPFNDENVKAKTPSKSASCANAPTHFPLFSDSKNQENGNKKTNEYLKLNGKQVCWFKIKF